MMFMEEEAPPRCSEKSCGENCDGYVFNLNRGCCVSVVTAYRTDRSCLYAIENFKTEC